MLRGKAKDDQHVHPIKAYKNNEFLMSEAARGVRILCEYVEPERRFRQTGVRNTVAFFGSARVRAGLGTDGRDWYAEAANLAEKLAAWTLKTHELRERFFVCTGGGPGIMEAANRGAHEAGALTIGLNIALPHEQGGNRFITPTLSYQFHYFALRKMHFMMRAKALVAFPGGFGTMDELFEVLTLVQTGKAKPVPIVLFGTEFWNRFLDFEALVEVGTITEADLDLFHLTDDPHDAWSRIQAFYQL